MNRKVMKQLQGAEQNLEPFVPPVVADQEQSELALRNPQSATCLFPIQCPTRRVKFLVIQTHVYDRAGIARAIELLDRHRGSLGNKNQSNILTSVCTLLKKNGQPIIELAMESVRPI